MEGARRHQTELATGMATGSTIPDEDSFQHESPPAWSRWLTAYTTLAVVGPAPATVAARKRKPMYSVQRKIDWNCLA
ncbi:hypothetical protein VTH82DRAFT_36 [Thermothelomyces myriococcoides]